MARAAQIVTALIGLLHIYIMVLEMFLWQTERAMKTFAMTPEYAATTAVLAGNQGLYNGFLAAGLLWGAVHRDPRIAFQLRVFFLACVALAGVYGAATAKFSILYVQTIPALIGLALVIAARKSAR